MSWERQESGPPNPLAWSLPCFPVAGIRFRVHFVFLAYALVVVLRARFGPAGAGTIQGAVTAASAIGALFAAVVVREFARAFVVRASGGHADDVVLWPLGCLQGIDPAPGWRSAFLAASVGPAASALLLAANGVALGIASGEWMGAALPDPFSAAWLANPHPWWMDGLWILQWTILQLSLISLIPMLPLDGGRAMEAFVLRRRGEFLAPRIAAGGSLGVAAAAGIVAMVRDLPTLLTVAIACAGHAAFLLWRLRAGDAVAAAQPRWSPPPEDEPDRERARERERAEQQRRHSAAEERAVDEVLEKIAREGADRLTDAERAILARATERRRTRG